MPVDNMTKSFITATAPLEEKIDSIRDSVRALETKATTITNSMDSVNKKIDSLSGELANLHRDFNNMIEGQQKTANLQRAISELVRVRQEIEQKYGSYTVIRQTMLGVLQATDAALVRKTTISQVSEELMLSTPQYWLAPCLVAVAAWISNNKELAERAIKEALKRDEEKTALAMALICRRNGRVETGYEWLSLYFAKQSATNFTEESFTYIDAYVNGVFGPDTRHSCQGYVSKWIDEVRGNKSGFETSQVNIWKEYCTKYSKDTDEEFPEMAKTVTEYKKIGNVVGRINGLPRIMQDFREMQEAYVDKETMKKAIDAELVRLIGNYDNSEIEIRKEEEYLSLVKYFRGDEDKAKAEMQAREAKRLQRKLDFIEQMSGEITSGKETTPSKKKTAVTFLSTYINKGVKQYIEESKNDFPEEVTISIDKWCGKSKEGSEFQDLSDDYALKMNKERESSIKYATTTKPMVLLILSIFFLVISIGLAVIGLIPFSGASLIAAATCFGLHIKAKKDTCRVIDKINKEYDDEIEIGKETLRKTLDQWARAKRKVENYEKLGDIKIVA